MTPKDAISKGADYIALGSFYSSKLKPKAKKAEIKNLIKIRSIIKKPIVAIGGVNNRNLKTFEVDINTSVHLSGCITDEETVIVSESGIHTLKDVSKLNNSGIFTFLIGEHLIKSTNASEEIGEFINA